MHISRRHFFSVATGLTTSVTSVARGLARAWPDPRLEPLAARPTDSLDCVLLDLEGSCGLRESLAGYEAALAGASVRFVRSTPGVLPQARAVIVPGCVRLEPSVASALRSSLERGSLLVIESGAAFAGTADLAVHQRVLHSHFGLAVEPPAELWTDESRKELSRRCEPSLVASKGLRKGSRVPYVDYTWPVPAKVRDFSRVIPLASTSQLAEAPAREVIGWVEGRPVAVRRAVGKGTLVFLGSPLGPALRSGDREAAGWLSALLGAA